MVVRIGQGFDVHRFGAAGPLTLCGCVIENERGLEGHSDADVALHAVSDALLGAAALGDLGDHFPDTDPKWYGVDSAVILRKALDLVHREGFVVGNCDLTLICERPRIAPHRPQMRASLAGLLAVDKTAVSVKATTTEGLGFTGRNEGLAAMAVVLIQKGAESG